MVLETGFTLVRTIHELAALIALGQAAYSRLIRRAFTERARSVVAESLAISVVAALGWLLCEAANMSGLPLSEALSTSVISVVLGQTLFGHVWMLRLVLGIALCGWIMLLQRSARAPPKARNRGYSACSLFMWQRWRS